MAINDIVQYVSGFIPYILLFTQAPILVWLDGTIIDISTILVTLLPLSHKSGALCLYEPLPVFDALGDDFSKSLTFF